MEEKIEEGLIKGEQRFKLLKDTKKKNMIKYICKISGNKIGTGFFCKIKYKNELIPVLMTNYHIIDDYYIKNEKQIILYINDNMKIIKVEEDSIFYSSETNKYDIIIIKLKKGEVDNYLDIEENIFGENAENIFKNEQIYILHYPYGDEAAISYGCGFEKVEKVNDDNDYDYKHKCHTESGSSGSPILNALNNKVIGIHKGYINKNNFNIGTLLKFPLNELFQHKNQEAEIIIFIDSCEREEFDLRVNLSNTVKELKKMINEKLEEKYRIPEERMMLMFNGDIFYDGQTLDYYELEDYDSILMFRKIYGG